MINGINKLEADMERDRDLRQRLDSLRAEIRHTRLVLSIPGRA